MLDTLKSKLKAAVQKATGKSQLQEQPIPKITAKLQQSFPAYVTSTATSTAAVTKNDVNIANLDLTANYRFGASTAEVVRNLAKVNPDLAGAVSAHLRIGIPEKYCAFAYNPDGSFNVEATRLALSLLARWQTSPDYSVGFSQTDSLRSVFEALGKEGILYGGMLVELVLDKQRLPSYLQPIHVPQIKWFQDDKGLRPVQVVGGVDVDLDFPTVMYVAIDPVLTDPYPQSPIESAIQPVLASMQFLNDLRRVCARHTYPRYDVSLDEEKLKASIPLEIQADNEKLATYINSVFASVEQMINELGVEQALVHFDFVKVAYVGGGSTDVPDTFETVKSIHDAKIATGAKSMPAILGHGAGSQNIASTETMLALMTDNSLIRLKLMELMSRSLTMACRLFGQDVTVNFEFDTIDLRPDAELEAFKTMKESRIMNQLSFGFITDEEACLRLTGRLPPPGLTPLSGTRFRDLKSDIGSNPYSGSNAGGGQSGGGAATQSRAPSTPTKPGGSNK
jgi:hypothetical protein